MNKMPVFTNRRARRANGLHRIATHKGRPIRSPEGHEGANGGGADNGGGNSGAGGESGASEDNGGKAPDYSGFWSSEGDGQTGSPESGSAGTGQPSSSTQQPQNQGQQPQQPQIVQDLANGLQGMKFDNLMSPEMLESFSNGDVKGFNEGMQGFGQAVARQTMQLAIGVMKHMRADMMTEFESKMGGEFEGRERFQDLVGAIPAAGDFKNPASKTIRDIYAQALTRSKGDKQAAIQQTKDVMRLQAETFGGSLDLSVAPRSGGDGHYTSPPPKTNWLEELASHK